MGGAGSRLRRADPLTAPDIYLAACLAAYLAAVNLATFAAWGLDKRRAARGGRRVSERTLLTLALLGGTPAAFAGRVAWRHKTSKQPFATWLWLIAALQVFVTACVFYMLNIAA